MKKAFKVVIKWYSVIIKIIKILCNLPVKHVLTI